MKTGCSPTVDYINNSLIINSLIINCSLVAGFMKLIYEQKS